MLAFLACLFYAVYGTGFVLCIVLTIVFMNPTMSHGLSAMMHMDEHARKYGEQRLRKHMMLLAATATLVGKLLFIICWHYA